MDKGLHCFLKVQDVKGYMKPRLGPFSQSTLRDNRPANAVSAMIFVA